jgi:hypothetical protein
VTGDWRKLHKKKLHSLYSSPDFIRMMKSRMVRWARYVVCMEEVGYVYKILVGLPQGKKLLRRPKYRCEDNIKMDLREIGFRCLD